MFQLLALMLLVPCVDRDVRVIYFGVRCSPICRDQERELDDLRKHVNRLSVMEFDIDTHDAQPAMKHWHVAREGRNMPCIVITSYNERGNDPTVLTNVLYHERTFGFQSSAQLQEKVERYRQAATPPRDRWLDPVLPFKMSRASPMECRIWGTIFK